MQSIVLNIFVFLVFKSNIIIIPASLSSDHAINLNLFEYILYLRDYDIAKHVTPLLPNTVGIISYDLFLSAIGSNITILFAAG